MPRLTAARVKRISRKKILKVRQDKRREVRELSEQLDTLVGVIKEAVIALNDAMVLSKHYSKKHNH